MCGVRKRGHRSMLARIANFAGVALLRDLRERIESAAGIARAADAVASAGMTTKGVEVANEVDDLLYDAERLIGLVSLVARSSNPDARGPGSAVALLTHS